MELKDRIKAAMNHAGLEKSELAVRARVSKGAVTQWLDGTTKSLRADKAESIAAATGVSSKWLVTGFGLMTSSIVNTTPSPENPKNLQPLPSVWATIEHLGKLLDALPSDKQAEAVQRLGALALGDSEKNRAALVALLAPAHPAAETANFAGKPQSQEINQSTPTFFK